MDQPKKETLLMSAAVPGFKGIISLDCGRVKYRVEWKKTVVFHSTMEYGSWETCWKEGERGGRGCMDAEGRWPQAKGFAVRLYNSSLLCRSPAASQKTSTKYSDGDLCKFEVPENEKWRERSCFNVNFTSAAASLWEVALECGRRCRSARATCANFSENIVCL